MKTNCSIFFTALALAAIVPLQSFAASKMEFAKDIWPILEKNCLECHGAEKQKGKLRLDTKEAAFKGGENGASIVAGKGDESPLYKRTMLARDNDDAMPPKGDGLSKAQQAVLKQWIDEGAAWTEVVASKAAVDPVKVAGPKPTTAELKAVAKLAKYGVQARELASGVNWRYANFRVAGSKFDPQAFVALKDIANLQELNLSGVEVKDPDLANIAASANLAVLNLAGSTVTDAGLAHLKNLKELRSLNLFGTKITDAGLQYLAGLKGLKSLYLFESNVTDAGVAELSKALPETRIDRGWDLKELAQIDAAAKEAEAKAKEKAAASAKTDGKKDETRKPPNSKKKKEKK